MTTELKILNSFDIDNTGGNPAGLVLDADELSREQKQHIAAQAGLSETAFVSGSSVADFKLEFFTPTKQIPHCGHATIATFSYLKSIGRISANLSSKETIDGTRKISFIGAEAYMEQKSPRFTPIVEKQFLLDSLGITADALDTRFPLVAGNTGNTFLLIGLKNENLLATITPDFDNIAKLSNQYNAIGYYVFTTTTDNFDAQTRMLGPAYGIPEESATGMAAGPLACLLNNYLTPKNEFLIAQGKFMTPPSESRLRAKLIKNGDQISSLVVGGTAYVARTVSVSV
jgi:PhzF family phenazine biosynthesis protein